VIEGKPDFYLFGNSLDAFDAADSFLNTCFAAKLSTCPLRVIIPALAVTPI